ncbi:MAG: hypothetical protein AB1831_12125 [Pseudomonadota bacterium]
MKTWLITPLFLCATGLALAADKAPAEPHTPPAQPATAAKPEAAKPEASQSAAAPAQPAKPRYHKARRLPQGDLRQCLELKDNKAIIACAESRRKK